MKINQRLQDITSKGEADAKRMTFTSASGNAKWNPPEYDRILGEMIELPLEQENSNAKWS